VVVERPAESRDVLAVLHQGGWRAVAVAPRTPTAAAWVQFDQDPALPAAPVSEVRRGAGVAT